MDIPVEIGLSLIMLTLAFGTGFFLGWQMGHDKGEDEGYRSGYGAGLAHDKLRRNLKRKEARLMAKAILTKRTAADIIHDWPLDTNYSGTSRAQAEKKK